MKKHFTVYLILASLLVIVLAAVSSIGRPVADVPAPPAIGTVIDDFKLADASGKEHSLKSLMGAKGTVILFVATKCPVSNNYNERMEKLAQDYKAKGINVIGINSNNTEPAAEVKSHAAERGLTFPILKDEGNKIADRLGRDAHAGSLRARRQHEARLSRPHRQLAEDRRHHFQRSARRARRTGRGQGDHQDGRRSVRMHD